MVKTNPDGIIEAVRYAPDGRVELVRYYPRRGPTYADVHLLTRQQLIDQMRDGKRFQVGIRKGNLGSEFFLRSALHLTSASEDAFIRTSDSSSQSDDLSPAPII